MKSFPSLLALLACVTAHAGIDLDGNGRDDIWEQFYQAGQLAPQDDTDADGRTNLQEALAGTDPLAAASRLHISSAEKFGGSIFLTWPTAPGKSYWLQASTDLTQWTNASLAVLATDTELYAEIDLTGGKANLGREFYRVCARDVDSDGDGATDFEERLARTDPLLPQSHTPGRSDRDALIGALLHTSPSTVWVEVPDGQAYEVKAAGTGVDTGKIQLKRSGPLAAVTVNYTVSASPPTAGVDYVALAGTATFDFGVNSIDLPVTPIATAHLEVPEMLTLTLSTGGYYVGTPMSGTVRIDDFENQVERLYYAELGPETGVITTASGYSTIFLSGDHTRFRTSVSFANLTSVQPAMDGAHLHYTPTSAIVYELPGDQVVNDEWTLPATGVGALASDQAILDALTGGQLYVNIHTAFYPGGEILGGFVPVAGSITFTPPPPPLPPPIYTGDGFDRDVQRFLSQATFGQTDALFGEVKAIGIPNWVTQQMSVATLMTNLHAFVKAQDDWIIPIGAALPGFEPRYHGLINGWWNVAVHGRDQLRQRVALALSEIFVISVGNNSIRNRHYGTASYYDTLASHAFGNFRDLLEAVSKHPMMAMYLSSLKNEKAAADLSTSPDENYAREIMQLFSIGLVRLHPDGSLMLDATTATPIPTYGNSDIKELARVFTGWSYAVLQDLGAASVLGWNNDGPIVPNPDGGALPYGFYAPGSLGGPYAQAAFSTPLKNFPAYHDAHAKTVLGVTIPPSPIGEFDLDIALEVLFSHPNTGPFLARRLIQRLVTSTPSSGYVYRVAQIFANDGTGVRGHLGAVVRAILLDPEARTLSLAAETGYGKLREPLLRATHLLRAFRAQSTVPMSSVAAAATPAWTSPFAPTARLLRFLDTAESLGQAPLAAPSVFNWFRPDFTVPGAIAGAGLVAPEFQITDEVQIVNYTNFVSDLFWLPDGTLQTTPYLRGAPLPGSGPASGRIQLDLAAAVAAYTGGPDGITVLLNYLDRLFCHTAMSTDTRSAIVAALEELEFLSAGTDEIVRTAIYLVLTSPDYTVQR